MEITANESDGVWVIQFQGALDGQTSPVAQARLVELIKQGATKMLIDFERLSFISSAGLRVLLVTAKELQHVQGAVRIFGANESVLEVFEISGFSTIIPLADNRSEALEGI